MYHVRYYEERIHPDHFKTKGFLGWVVYALNVVRWGLETLIQRLVLRLLISECHVDKEQGKILRTVFNLDVKSEKLEKERSSPLTMLSADFEMPEVVPHRSDKYFEGRAKTKLESTQDGPKRPTPISDLAARYGGPARTVRYARGRQYTMIDPEGDFSTVNKPEEAGHGTATGLFEGLRKQRVGANRGSVVARNVAPLAIVRGGAEASPRDDRATQGSSPREGGGVREGIEGGQRGVS